MPIFKRNTDGEIELHPSDCETCNAGSQEPFSEPEMDMETLIAKAANCSLNAWQKLTPEEGEKRLKKACQARAKRLKRNKRHEQEQQEEDPAWPVPDLPKEYVWRVPSKQDLLDTQAAWIVHENQERRKDILEKASAKMAEALTTAGSLMAEALEMLKEM